MMLKAFQRVDVYLINQSKLMNYKKISRSIKLAS